MSLFRIHSVRMTTASKSGHPTSCSSMAEIISVLFFKVMKYKVAEPKAASNDRFILSKGHAAPILYAAWAEAGLFPASDLLNLRKINSDLEGHPTPRLNFIDVATGSLGQGLSVACGMAYVAKHFDNASYRTYCLMGDGESMEGNIWEALNFAGFYKLDNLVAIIDANRLGQSEPAPLQHDMETYKKRLQSFGFNAIVVDGHDVEELCKAFYEAETTKGMPTCIIAKTFKGKDFPDIENVLNWHGKALGDKTDAMISHLEGLLKNPGAENLPISAPVNDAPVVDISGVALSAPPSYAKGQTLATREAYGNALAKLATSHSRVVALDGDMKNSTFSQSILKVDPNRFIECFICEQNMIGVGIGVACRDRTVAFASTFAAFLTRAFDNLRMGVISQTNLNVVGSHAGISIGEDGPSQMALEDLAMFQSLPGCTVFYPSDAVSTERATELAANTRGVCFIRVGRPVVPIVYENSEQFQIGKAKVVRQSDSDKVLVIAAGITLFEALKAADTLAAQGVNVRVLDPFTIKPIDVQAVQENAAACGGRIITVEDHYPEGGLGDAVLAAVATCRNVIVQKLAVNSVPRSGPPAKLLEMFGISANHIVRACNDIQKL
ncbi:transketolase-like protein 2 [Eurytemora carolleeae]|uniref:transketolase-like protein 2 n=1 Tax=Eurytemora carolleeae TaxID=1294199 RepID=UPI000C77AA57|nr:transketolase-like protein 2 [Eurytemora carolleeae]|eukprot:XP_023319672.1 transketolase-like protein 2 [Eurytemora affinis]